MSVTRYLIVGGGMTGDAAAKGIREHDPDGAVTVVGAEAHQPYARPPLSKKLWTGQSEDRIWRGTAETGAQVVAGRRVVAIDLDACSAADDAGTRYDWDRLLLATGGTPRELPGSDGVVYFRTLDDYHLLRSRTAAAGARAIVIGGGFIGSELAASLSTVGSEVTMVFPEPGICWRLLPADLSEFVTGYYRERGVAVRTDETVAAASAGSVDTGSGETLTGDVVVAGLGIVPDTSLAEAAGLPVDDGILVDVYGRVEGQEDVFAAGDVARFPSTALGGRIRVEHEDHAKTHGRVVGANMAGAEIPYEHLPFFYSDMFDLGYEAVGELDSRLETVAIWEEPFRKGVVTYVDAERRPRGVLNWNVWDGVDGARALIEERRPVA
jgi:3-phenylpropionate/trans-cinnamate dioxygenase ferredoxin reductase component